MTNAKGQKVYMKSFGKDKKYANNYWWKIGKNEKIEYTSFCYNLDTESYEVRWVYKNKI